MISFQETVSGRATSNAASKAICALAMIKVGIDEGRDHIDNFIPFLATLIHTHGYNSIDAYKVVNDFESDFGLKIPYHAMITILRRAQRKKLITKNLFHQFVPTDKINQIEFSSEALRKGKELSNVIDELIAYCRDIHKVELIRDEAEATLISFLREQSADFFINGRFVFLPDSEASYQKRYLFNKFLKLNYEKKTNTFHNIVGLAVGHIYANTLTYKDFEPNKGIRNLTCYLDTKFVFRLLGLEGKEREAAYIELVNSINENGAKMVVFQHTYLEILGILRDAEKWIQRPDYNPLKASIALRYFVLTQCSASDIRFIAAKLEEKLKVDKIEIIESPNLLDLSSYVMCEKTLAECIESVYKEHNPDYNATSNEFSIQRDVKSLSSVCALRKGKRYIKLQDAEHIFVTTNTGLAIAEKRYWKLEAEPKYIPVCLSDIILGTLLWLEAPAKIELLNEKKILADCVAALQPNELLLKKFSQQVEKLLSDKQITQEDSVLLRTQNAALDLLSEKTLSDPNCFSENTSQEILEEVKARIQKESDKKFDEEKNKHQKTQNKANELDKQLSNVHGKIHKLAEGIALIVSSIVFIGLLAVAFYGYTLPFINSFEHSNWIQTGIVCAFALISLATGLLSKIKNGLRNYIKEKIISIFVNN